MASHRIYEDPVIPDANPHSDRPSWTSKRRVQSPNNGISENVGWDNQALSTERDSGYSFKGLLATVVGLVLIAFIKDPWSICFGTFLAFAGLLSPFYGGPLWEFTQRFRLGIKHEWGYSVQARLTQVQPTRMMRLPPEKTAQEVRPMVQDLKPPEEAMHQELAWHAQVSLDYHLRKTSPLPADGRHKDINTQAINYPYGQFRPAGLSPRKGNGVSAGIETGIWKRP